MQANLPFNLGTDTYERELKRYGPLNMNRCERLQYDSEAVTQVLALLGGPGNDQARWQLALYSVDALLTDFGRRPEEKMRLMQRLRQGFKAEAAADSAEAKKAFGARYRQVKAQLDNLLNPLRASDDDLAPARAAFAERSCQGAPIVLLILQQAAAGLLAVGLDDLLASYVHMALNRFFRSKHRLQETVFYDFLHQYSSSLVARSARPRSVPTQ